MLYYGSKLYSSTNFEIQVDMQLWQQLIPKVVQLDESVWKFWMVADIFRANDIQLQAASLTRELQPTDTVVQTAASYLRVEATPSRTIFTLVSPNQSALENLAALVENLYSEVTPVSLHKFIDENEQFPVQTVRAFGIKTGEESLKTFTESVSLRNVRSSIFPVSDWDLISVSTVTPNLASFPGVEELYLNRISDYASFFVSEEALSLVRGELAQVYSIFNFTDKVFIEEWEISSSSSDSGTTQAKGINSYTTDQGYNTYNNQERFFY